MGHIRYPKIRHLNHEDVEGITDGVVYVQEKIDGSNLSIRMEKGMCAGSRTVTIMDDGEIIKGFNGAAGYVLDHEGIRQYLMDNPTHRLYGERLVKHSIPYPEHHYNHFRLFDIAIPEHVGDDVYNMHYLPIKRVYEVAEQYNIKVPHLMHEGKWEDFDQSTIGISHTGAREAEGVVIKNEEFINKWGVQCYAKVVTDRFKEANRLAFGSYARGDVEDEFSAKYISQARVSKIINKIEQLEGRVLDKSDTPRVMGMAYHDAFEEHLWGFCSKKTIDFYRLAKMCRDRARAIFHGILDKDPLYFDFENEEDNTIERTTCIREEHVG